MAILYQLSNQFNEPFITQLTLTKYDVAILLQYYPTRFSAEFLSYILYLDTKTQSILWSMLTKKFFDSQYNF